VALTAGSITLLIAGIGAALCPIREEQEGRNA